MQAAPQLVESYRKDVAPNPKVEMIHISRDRNNTAALNWAENQKFPWPTIMKDETDAALMTHYSNRVPSYILIDHEGNKIAEGKGAIWAKIKTLK
ncbi:MAG: hypothetical protein VCA40_04845 [Roseibacillus sp.]